MYDIDINKLDNETPLTNEEGYELTKHYVSYFWNTHKFYSLEGTCELDDIISTIYIKFLEKNFFTKYNCSITSKKYHVMNAVKNSMIDMLRKHRDTVSMEKETEEGLTVADVIADKSISTSDEAEGMLSRNKIIEALPDTCNSEIVGYSELLGREVNISYRMLALHLESGYSIKDLAQMYSNPISGQSVTEGTVSRYIRLMREFVLDTVVLY